MSAKQDNNISKLSFEQAIKELTGIVEKIELGEIPLESSLQQYERGMALIGHCRTILQKAEKRIEKISREQETEDSRQKTDDRRRMTEDG
jgi:exodeoxyribonuclease VII small subunit